MDMNKRGIRIEKPLNHQAPAAPPRPSRLGFFFRFLLILSFLLAVLSLVIIYLTMREHVVPA